MLLAVSCGPSEPSGGHLIRLLDHLEQADIDCPDRDILETGRRPQEAQDWLLEEHFEGRSGTAWYSSSGEGVVDEPLRGCRWVVGAGEDSGALAVLPASGGLRIEQPAAADRSFLVQARVQVAAAGEGPAPLLFVVPLVDRPRGDQPRPDAADLPNWRMLGLQDSWSLALDPAREGEWQDVELVLGPVAGRQGVRVVVFPGQSALKLDRVRMRRLLPVELAAARHLASPRASPFRQQVEVGLQTGDCLLLPARTRVTFSVRVPPTAPRLDLERAVEARGSVGEFALTVRVNGEAIGTDRVAVTDGEQQDFEAWVLPLGRWAGKAVQLTFETGDSGDLLGLVAAPKLLGRPARRPGTSVILLSIDTLRADLLGCYGSALGLSPNIDRLAAQGTVFTRMQSPSSYTLPTHTSMMTGQSPLVHRVLYPSQAIDRSRSRLLAERLAERNYATAAFTGGGFVSPRFGFAAGFDRYDTSDLGGVRGLFRPQRSEHPDELLQPLWDWWDRHADQSFFLFLHTFVVHNYTPRERYLLPRIEGEDPALYAADSLPELWQRASDGDAAAARIFRKLYEATVAQVDAELVSPLLRELDRRGLAEQTIVCLVSDHGEAFLEHDQMAHGHTLFGELVRIPWILRGPGIPAARRDELVELSDLAPTLATLLGLAPDPLATGRDALAAPPADEPGVFLLYRAEDGSSRWEGWVGSEWKLLRHLQPGVEPERLLFRTDADPLDAHDRAADNRELLESLEEILTRGVEQREEEAARRGALTPAAADVDSALRQHLQELGYEVDDSR